MSQPQNVTLSLTAVIVAVTDEVPRVLVARRMSHDLATPMQQGTVPPSAGGLLAAVGDSPDALPYGPFQPALHRTLDHGCRLWLAEQTGLSLRFLEQLYTFGGQFRDPSEAVGGPRVVTVAYLGLMQEAGLAGSGDAVWCDCYGYLPWEDWRNGRPEVIDAFIRPRLKGWAEAAPTEDARRLRLDRLDFAFGAEISGRYDPMSALERYELLYEAGLVPEAIRDEAEHARARGETSALDASRLAAAALGAARLGHPMSQDNRRILASALGRLRGKLAYRPVVFELLPEVFTLLQLQRVVEALIGSSLHKQNFRRTITNSDLVEPTGRQEATGRGRPAELFRFRRDVLLERRTAGIGVSLPRDGGAV